MTERTSDSRAQLMILKADADAWLDSQPPPTDTSMLYRKLLELPFIFNLPKRYAAYVTQNEQTLKLAFCIGRERGSLPLPLPRSMSECACADLSGLEVQKIYLSGSARDCSDVRIIAEETSDIDVMLQLGPVNVKTPGKRPGLGTGQEAVGVGTYQQGLKVTQKRTSQPGFVLLQHQQLESCQHVAPLAVNTDQVLRILDSFRLQTTGWPSSHSGPSVATTYPDISGDNTSIDLVACVLCPVWPHEDFASRWRSSGFPSSHLVEKLCRTPAFLVPVGFHGSETEAHEWRLSFSRQEYIVYRSMSEQQRLCLNVLKHCRAVIGNDAKPLKSFYLKTALLWLAETRAPDQWTPETMHESLLLILGYLEVCLRRGYLPCYFWPEMNLLAGRSNAERAEVSAAVTELRRRLLPAVLALMAYWLGQPAASLAQNLLADCRGLSPQQLNLMVYAKSLGSLVCGDLRPTIKLTELLLNGKLLPFDEELPLPLCPTLSLSFLTSRCLTRNSSRDQSGKEDLTSIVSSMLTMLVQLGQQMLDHDSIEDSWMI